MRRADPLKKRGKGTDYINAELDAYEAAMKKVISRLTPADLPTGKDFVLPPGEREPVFEADYDAEAEVCREELRAEGFLGVRKEKPMSTIYLQVVERHGSGLFKALQAAMRDGTLQTFFLEKRGTKVVHTNATYPGWMNWSNQHGVITATVLSPKKPGSEWKLLSAFVGRLADRYSDSILSISIQFGPPREKASVTAKKKKR